MNFAHFQSLTSTYSKLRIAVIGDFCLDRYLEIDPSKKEVSIETNLPVYNVVRVRAQPGGAGTILNNLVALGIGMIYPVSFCGVDGEGFELRQVLAAQPGVTLEHFIQTPLRRTFTYCKPLLVEPGKAPVELNRLDSKNWTATPVTLQQQLANAVLALANQLDAIIILSQVDNPETGVVTSTLLRTIQSIAQKNPELLILADSRTGLHGYPPVCLKMNRAECQRLLGTQTDLDLSGVKKAATDLARRQGRMVFVTLAEQGMVGASPDASSEHVPALPLRGEIDIVGAGDAVTANLAAALASGAGLREALEIANTASSIVIHQLGTTGSASVAQIRELLARI